MRISPDTDLVPYSVTQQEAKSFISHTLADVREEIDVVDDTVEMLEAFEYEVSRSSISTDLDGRRIEGEHVGWQTEGMSYGLIFSGQDIYVSDNSSHAGFTELGMFHLNRQAPVSAREKAESLIRLDSASFGERTYVAFEYAQGQPVTA